jgi:PhnB protein
MTKHNRIVPYLTVEAGLQAIKFYEEAFDAEEIAFMMAGDGKRVLHAELELNGNPLMLSDSFPEMGDHGAPPSDAAVESSVTILLDFKKPKKVDRTAERAAKAGATIIMAARDMFWGARYPRLRDPFGHVWALNAPLKKKDREKHEDKAARSPRL